MFNHKWFWVDIWILSTYSATLVSDLIQLGSPQMPLARTAGPFMRCLLGHTHMKKFVAINSIVIGSLVLPNLATAGVCYSSSSYSAVTNTGPMVALSEPIPAGAAFTVAWSSASISSVRVVFDHSATSTFISGQSDLLNSLNAISGSSSYTETIPSASNGGSATNYFRFNPDLPAVFSNLVISSATCTGTGSSSRGSSSSSGTPATPVPTLPLFGLLALGGLLGFFGLRKLKQ